jgi:hypothetical protein
MLISFVGPRHARILLVNFNGERLCIEMSTLPPISGNDNTSMDTLIRWWDGKANPNVATNMPFEYVDGVEDLPPSTPTSEWLA